MTLTALAIVVLSIWAVGAATKKTGLAAVIMALALVVSSIIPRFLTSTGPAGHVGIAPAVPAVATYGILVVGGAALLVLGSGLPRRSAVWLPFIVWMAVGTAFAWDVDAAAWSGVGHLLLAPAAWLIGFRTGMRVTAGARRVLLFTVSLIVVAEAFVVLAQTAGIAINPMSSVQAVLMEGRFNGTLDHPNILGRLVVLLVVLVLALAPAMDLRGRRRIAVVLVAALGLLLLTGGRAAVFGFLAILVTWLALLPGTRQRVAWKVVATWGVIAATGVAVVALSGRLADDGEGDARRHLAVVAGDVIRQEPVWGVGPNHYVSAGGAVDALTGSGVPVHNVGLLAAAELGWVGAAALALPLAAAAVRALPRLRSRGPAGDASRALVAFLPALALLGGTGWSLLAGVLLPMVFVVVGFLDGAMSTSAGDGDIAHASDDHAVTATTAAARATA
ncbi:O-antigen ligase family protein [Cellulomonas fimi]|uniref:O-antigen ligase family protein n=1 Tax=Cellulomonas fimi TaxID=1708 RepID=UPI002359FE7F|nr:O-antigen ligase family protein [Cellulomonas fimi]